MLQRDLMPTRAPSRRRGFLAYAASLTFACASAVGGQEAPNGKPPAPSFVSSAAELVVLPVTVTDKRGAFVGDLSAERFSVYDNGRRQQVAVFSNDDTPVTIGLVIDTSGSMAPKLPEVIAATVTFARLSNPDDELFTIAFNDRVGERSRDRVRVAADIAALESDLRSLMPRGRTALYDALVASLERLEEGTKARKALILVSDGGDNASQATMNDVLARAQRSSVAIYTIGLFDEIDPDRNPGVLKALAQATGGERFLPSSPGRLVQTCERIARELRSSYTLGYVPPDHDGSFHRVRVDIAPPPGLKLTVRTRPGYFASASGGSRP